MKNIFVTGIFRSGTSLLSTALNTHKDILVCWQPYWLFFKACRNKFFKDVLKREFDADCPMGMLQLDGPEERRLFLELFEKVAFNRAELDALVSKIKEYLSHDEAINKRMKPFALVSQLDGLDPGDAGYILSQLMERLRLCSAGKEDVKWVGIKEPFCDGYIGPILNYKGLEPVILHIIRDPRSVLASRNYGKYMETTKGRYPVFLIIRAWRKAVESYILNQGKKNYMMLRYEDLVERPGEIFKEICGILQVQFSEDILDPGRYKDSKGWQWEQNSSFEVSGDISTSSVNKWQEVLSTDEIELVEYFCQSEMEYLRYKAKTGDLGPKKIAGFNEAKEAITPWLRNYDFSYKAPQPCLD
ncbi:MAG: sulfotransferase [Candidatus Omnitrophica bacterium]|nr:sulfotransferase [Candidatus Omnitrophota bacterium]